MYNTIDKDAENGKWTNSGWKWGMQEKVGSAGDSCLISGLYILQMCFYKDESCGYG